MKNSARRLFLVMSTALISCFTAQAQKSKTPKPFVIAKIGNDKVYSDEFQRLYEKSYSQEDSIYSLASMQEYLDLFVKYKLKVKEAYSLEINKEESFSEEFEMYRKQLAAPYLTDSKVTEAIVKEAYERMQEEVHAAHVLIKVGQDASPEDSLKAYNKVMAIRKSAIESDTTFGDLAKKYSEDPSAARNGGDLGFFTAMQMVYPFESAAYNCPAGEISMPVRSRFGYHLIEVKERRPARGSIEVAHIMIRLAPGQDTSIAYGKIASIHQKLIAGEKWNDLTAQFSEDPSTSKKGGVLPAFGSSDMIPSFANASFNLDNTDQISEPIKTPYGYHLIKLIKKNPIASFDESKSSIERKVSRDNRSALTKEKFLAKLRVENELKVDSVQLNNVLGSFSDSLLFGNWVLEDTVEWYEKEVLSFKESTVFPVAGFIKYAAYNQAYQPRKKTAEQYGEELFERYSDSLLLAYEEEHLADKYPEYRYLVQEYKDGLLLFEVMERQVWQKAQEDTAGFNKFFNDSIRNYMWGERANAVVISAANDSLRKEAVSWLQKKTYPVVGKKIPSLNFEKEAFSFTQETRDTLNNVVSLLRESPDYKLFIKANKDSEDQIIKNRLYKIQWFLINSKIDSARIIVADDFETIQGNPSISFSMVSSDPMDLEALFNRDAALALKVTTGKFEKGDNEWVDQSDWKEELVYTTEANGRFIAVGISALIEPESKVVTEVRGQVLSDYQTYLEATWLDALAKKYPVKANNKKLKKLVK